MPAGFATLRNFSENELVFDEAETKDILKFFFPHLRQRIETAIVTTDLRNFQLAHGFASVFPMMLDGIAGGIQMQPIRLAHVRYGKSSNTDKLWG